MNESVHLYNPENGWLQNCNSTPFTVAGKYSPKKLDYANYLAPDGENFRGVNAARLLAGNSAFTIDKMIAVGYNRQLAAFEILTPALINAFEKNIHPGDSLFSLLADPIAELKKWNYSMDENSVATLLAIEWAEHLPAPVRKVYIEEGEKSQVESTKDFAAIATANDLLLPLASVVNELKAKHGNWKITWGTVNRYQRISSDINQQYNDKEESFPIGFASALWGALPSYVSKYFNGSNNRYGVSGNSFVCAVEFGKKVKAKSLLAGGNSGDIKSKHFNDQLKMYCIGQFKEVLFYKEDVLKYKEKEYHPGE